MANTIIPIDLNNLNIDKLINEILNIVPTSNINLNDLANASNISNDYIDKLNIINQQIDIYGSSLDNQIKIYETFSTQMTLMNENLEKSIDYNILLKLKEKIIALNEKINAIKQKCILINDHYNLNTIANAQNMIGNINKKLEEI